MFWLNSAIQAVPSACSRRPPVGRGELRSKMPTLSRPRKPPSKRLRPAGSLRLTHQVKFSSSLLNEDERKSRSTPSGSPSARPTSSEWMSMRGEGVDGRVHVAEVPLVGRDLARRVQVGLGEHEVELALGEVGVDHAQGDGVEGQVPRRVPGVLPLVGHGDDVVVDHVEPGLVPGPPPPGRAQRVGVVLAEPHVEVEVVALLRPQHPRQRLAHDRRRVVAPPRAA